MLEVRATWRLDRLVFDRRELQVASLEASAAPRAAAAREARHPRLLRLAARPELARRLGDRAEEVAAELDALTDGWFSSNWPRENS